jgi:hypothetical protein
MANDKDFVVAGAVEVGKDTKVTLGTVTSNNIDLATGNYFADTPTGTSTYTISNAGDVQSFQLEVTGGTAAVASAFSTTLYTGTGNSLPIVNNIDLAGDGGLVWTKRRNSANSNWFLDADRGGTNIIRSNTNEAQFTSSGLEITSFNSNGYTLGTASDINSTSGNDVSWTFKKQAKFFDIVTYTGNGVTGREIPHSLGSDVGLLIIKCTSSSNFWFTHHISRPSGALFLDSADAETTGSTKYYMGNDVSVIQPTSTHFTVGGSTAGTMVNGSGETYVAYLFAHDDAADGLIQCGSYTGNSSTDGPEINLGWQPQWLLIKDTTGSQGSWSIFDTARGIVTSDIDPVLQANLSNAEYTGTNYLDALLTGFKLTVGGGSYGTTQDTHVNYTGHTYIYIAIRAASDPDITWPSSIEWAGGIAPSAPAVGETDVYTFTTDDGGTTYTGVQSIDNAS